MSSELARKNRHKPLQLISVVIPARDEEGCIASTIEHLHLELELRGVPHEIIVVDDGLREMIHMGASEPEMEKQARLHSMGIRDDGRSKVLAGMTTIDEILRVTMAD